jgi:hypothetical protein
MDKILGQNSKLEHDIHLKNQEVPSKVQAIIDEEKMELQK